jgi:uncharacterized membrane protein
MPALLWVPLMMMFEHFSKMMTLYLSKMMTLYLSKMMTLHLSKMMTLHFHQMILSHQNGSAYTSCRTWVALAQCRSLLGMT